MRCGGVEVFCVSTKKTGLRGHLFSTLRALQARHRGNDGRVPLQQLISQHHHIGRSNVAILPDVRVLV
jgi:hypothetical protein